MKLWLCARRRRDVELSCDAESMVRCRRCCEIRQGREKRQDALDTEASGLYEHAYGLSLVAVEEAAGLGRESSQ
jgi:hypothetical protein